LTSTGNKYLELAISAGPISCVEIIIGDIHGRQIILSHSTWLALLQKRTDIDGLMQPTSPSPAILVSQDLNVEPVKLYNNNIVKLTVRDTSIYMKLSTVCFMLGLEHCVEHIYYSLHQYVYIVSEKYKLFVSLVRQTSYIYNQCDAEKLLREKYDKTSLIDCEMFTYALNKIVHDALHDKYEK
jgi:hypothetical protein